MTARLISVRELASLLAVPERTVYRLAAEGVAGFYRIRRTWRADPDRVLEALEPAGTAAEGRSSPQR